MASAKPDVIARHVTFYFEDKNDVDNDQLQRFMDEAFIRNHIARFADAATGSDFEMFRTVRAEDGEFIIGQAPHGQYSTQGR